MVSFSLAALRQTLALAKLRKTFERGKQEKAAAADSCLTKTLAIAALSEPQKALSTIVERAF